MRLRVRRACFSLEGFHYRPYGDWKTPMAQPCQLTLAYNLDSGANYLDLARSLSAVNRKLYRQGRVYVVAGITFQWKGVAQDNNLAISVATAADSWVVRNAWTKGHALWRQMQALVLEDNPSLKGKWHDFKVQLDGGHSSGNTKNVQNWEGHGTTGNPVTLGEWNMSTYVMPQHEVDPATGEPLVADEFTAVLIGDNTASKKSLVLAYQESRAQVQRAPALDPGMEEGFFSLLTDSGSQEPELAEVIGEENDEAPYDMDEYPGADVNSVEPWCQGFDTVSAFSPTGRLPGFVAPCGLVKVTTSAFNPDGSETDAPDDVRCLVHMFPGKYSGVLAEAM